MKRTVAFIAAIFTLIVVLGYGGFNIRARDSSASMSPSPTAECALAVDYAATLVQLADQANQLILSESLDPVAGWTDQSLDLIGDLLFRAVQCLAKSPGTDADQFSASVLVVLEDGLRVFTERAHNLEVSQAEKIATLTAEREEYLAQTPALVYPLISTTGGSADATAMVYMDPDPNGWGGIVAFRGMTPPPSGQVYQLWMIADGQALPGPVFMPDAFGQAMIQVPGDAAASQAMAITMEPDGGSETPSTMPIMQSDLTA